jgi:mRNA-degrading endonuclease RelE of RelBE toxin-antitoxin system
MKIFSEVRPLPEFNKDLKKLLKRFQSLDGDMDTFIETQLPLFHKLRIENKGIFQISGLKIEYPKIYKAKKFACRALKGKGVNSGMRIIYAYFEQEDRIELIEIYFKGDKENEDRGRIIKYYQTR